MEVLMPRMNLLTKVEQKFDPRIFFWNNTDIKSNSIAACDILVFTEIILG